MAIYFKHQDPELPLVIAKENWGKIHFHCPRCDKALTLRRIEYRMSVVCSKEHKGCGKAFQVATKKQVRQAEKQIAKSKKEIARQAAKLCKSGSAPPDRISVFGVSSSGKSVLLASMYHLLWSGTSELSARALHGEDHQHLLDDFHALSEGTWLPATTRTRAYDLSLQFNGIKLSLSSLDYPGEVFTDVFFRKRIDTPDRQKLYDQIQSTLGALIVVDPEHAVSSDTELDVEFAGIEVAEHLVNRGLGENIVIVFSKRNQNKRLVESAGGPEAFLEQYLPRLAEAAPSASVFHISAIPTEVTPQHVRIPTAEGLDPDEVLGPLLCLLDRIDPSYLAVIEQYAQQAMSAAIQFEQNSEEPATAVEKPTVGTEVQGE